MRVGLVVAAVFWLLASAALFAVGTSAVHEILATLTGVMGALFLCARALVVALDEARDALLAELRSAAEYQREVALDVRARQGRG